MYAMLYFMHCIHRQPWVLVAATTAPLQQDRQAVQSLWVTLQQQMAAAGVLLRSVWRWQQTTRMQQT